MMRSRDLVGGVQCGVKRSAAGEGSTSCMHTKRASIALPFTIQVLIRNPHFVYGYNGYNILALALQESLSLLATTLRTILPVLGFVVLRRSTVLVIIPVFGALWDF